MCSRCSMIRFSYGSDPRGVTSICFCGATARVGATVLRDVCRCASVRSDDVATLGCNRFVATLFRKLVDVIGAGAARWVLRCICPPEGDTSEGFKRILLHSISDVAWLLVGLPVLPTISDLTWLLADVLTRLPLALDSHCIWRTQLYFY